MAAKQLRNKENIKASSKIPVAVLRPRPALGDLNNITAAIQPLALKTESPKTAFSAIKIDEDFSSDPQQVEEYVSDIFTYLLQRESKFLIRPNFLENHKSTPKMRAILVDWLVQVHGKYRLLLETLQMTISVIDRYLQENPNVGRETLQLVGITSLFICCKYEEMYYPDVDDFIYVCDNTYSCRQILKMEISILKCLDGELGRPLPLHFLRRFSKLANANPIEHDLGKFILELALVEHSASHYKPSMQAAAVITLSMAILRNLDCPSKAWSERLYKEARYRYSEFRSIVQAFSKILLKIGTCKQYGGIIEKYSHSKVNKVSEIPKLKGSLVQRLAGGSDT